MGDFLKTPKPPLPRSLERMLTTMLPSLNGIVHALAGCSVGRSESPFMGMGPSYEVSGSVVFAFGTLNPLTLPFLLEAAFFGLLHVSRY